MTQLFISGYCNHKTCSVACDLLSLFMWQSCDSHVTGSSPSLYSWTVQCSPSCGVHGRTNSLSAKMVGLVSSIMQVCYWITPSWQLKLKLALPPDSALYEALIYNPCIMLHNKYYYLGSTLECCSYVSLVWCPTHGNVRVIYTPPYSAFTEYKVLV